MVFEMNIGGERIAKKVDKPRLEEFMHKYFETEKFKSDLKLADYFWNEIREFGNGNNSYLNKNDLLLLHYLRVSGYGTHFEKLCSRHRFDFSDEYDLVFKVWIIKFLTIAKAGIEKGWFGVLWYTTGLLSPYRVYYIEMVNEIRSFMIKSGIDWVPIKLEHESVNFNKLNPVEVKDGNILHAFGFKSGSIKNEILQGGSIKSVISEGQVTALPDGRFKDYCIFNGIKYEVNWLSGLVFNKTDFGDSKDWVYDWNKLRLKRCICIVLSQGRVLHVFGRESISPFTGSMMYILGK